MSKLIEVKNLTYSIPYGRTILDNVSFELHAGEMLGILGRNGVGKTTLTDILLGVRPLTSGEVKILGEEPLAEQRVNRTSICYLSQDVLFMGSSTVAQFLNFYSSLYPSYSSEEETILLNFFNINREDKIGSLSTGQQKKVGVIACLSAMPKILLVDEITAVLDPETRGQFFSAIKRHQEQYGLCIILATNIAEDLISRANSVLFLDKGKGAIYSPSEILHLFNLGKVA